MAYLVRRLLENTSNESFLRHRFAEGKELDELIAPPEADPEHLPELVQAMPTPDGGPFRNEPHAELRRPGPRARLAAAVAQAPDGFGFDAPVVIEGRRVRTPDVIVSVDPGQTSRVVCRSGRATQQEADRALEAAHRAFPAWAGAGAAARAEVLFRAARLMRERRSELVALEVFEAGKPWAEADADVAEAIDFCEYYGREALRLQDVRVLQAPGETNVYHYKPRGIAVVISPWNFPLAIPCGMVTAALVCGNCVLFKPAEQTPGIAFRLVEILLEAGCPPGALAFLPGVGEEVGAYLVDHPDVANIAFTGSKAVGLHIIERAAVHAPGQAHVKRVVAEMGGKNAVIVDSDADLDVAVPAIVKSAFGYAGQKCSAAARVICVGRALEGVVERLRGAAALVPVGHPAQMRTVLGPLIDEDAYKRVRSYQELAGEEGEVVYQGEDVPSGGWYVGPTVMVTGDPTGRVMTEEIFGPVVGVIGAGDFDHAMELANRGTYALTGGVFSRSPVHISTAAAGLRAGNVYINRNITGALVGRQPFGGYGLSGAGTKAGGPDYLLQFCEPRVVTENTLRQGFAPMD
jgi:RHH-type proline utilization regulon transcriptional repressor/proline dehydrogenase/delta 1-pyrroline-5-carboxylate dehydrogenase